MKHSLVVPTVNLNGNTARDLVNQLRPVLRAINEVMSVMVKASDVVHGRNFQLAAEPQACQREAQTAWIERLAELEAFHLEVLNLAMAIQEQERDLVQVH